MGALWAGEAEGTGLWPSEMYEPGVGRGSIWVFPVVKFPFIQ